MDLHYEDIAPGMSAIGLHRAVLLHHLELGMQRHGVSLRLGAEVASVDNDNNSLQLATGETLGPFDLVILADGARSSLRKSLGIRSKSKPYAWGALWHMAAIDSSRDHLFQVVDGARRMVGTLPTGRNVENNSELTSLFWSVHCDRVESLRRGGLDSWKQEVRSMMPSSEAILDDIVDWEQLTFARYHDVRMASWHRDNIVIIGDAAHATSPQLGQGVNLALWDAMVLADALASSPTVGEALHCFQQGRRRHLAYYQWATRFLTPFFQSDSRVLGGIRNLGLSVASSIGPLRRQMVYTMAGLKRGLLRSSLALPVPPAALSAASQEPHTQ